MQDFTLNNEEVRQDRFTEATERAEQIQHSIEEITNKRRYSDACRAMGQNMLDFISQSPAAWQACDTAERLLNDCGFEKIEAKDLAKAQVGDKKYITINGSSLIAWSVGKSAYQAGMRIWGSHLDSPALQIKPNSLIEKEGVLILNCAIYGGPLLNTYFDRPLSLAGVVTLHNHAGDQAVSNVLIDLAPLKIILPSLAIHFNRMANEGVKIEKQKVLLPVLGLAKNDQIVTAAHSAAKNSAHALPKTDNGGSSIKLFEELIAQNLGCDISDILDYDLRTYVCEPPCFVGLNEELLSTGRLDDLGMSIPGIYGFVAAHSDEGDFAKTFSNEFDGIKVLYLADNEEIGSNTKQGADTIWLRQTLNTICLGLGAKETDFPGILDKSLMISADMAHAVHPNYAEYADISNRPRLNEGPVLKINPGRYSTDADSAARFRLICEAAAVPLQTFMNRTDLPGGTTIGPITTAYLPMPNVDIGNPMLAMHSCRELAGVLDAYYGKRISEMFFRKPLV